jgi:hypothetical protein
MVDYQERISKDFPLKAWIYGIPVVSLLCNKT